jgi:HAE1 family hydrophobic/amphiphilic exporter-1
MGRAIIGGVVTSTLLTLVVVPVLYSYLDDWAEYRRAHGQHASGARGRQPPRANPAAPAPAEG